MKTQMLGNPYGPDAIEGQNPVAEMTRRPPADAVFQPLGNPYAAQTLGNLSTSEALHTVLALLADNMRAGTILLNALEASAKGPGALAADSRALREVALKRAYR